MNYIKNTIKLIIIVSIFFSRALAFENLSVLVLSCDKYNSLWKGFFHQLYKEWPELKSEDSNIPIYLMSNQMEYKDDRIQMAYTKIEESYTDNLAEALQKINTKYVLIVLDDYYLTQVNRPRLQEIFNYMSNNDSVGYIQIGGYFMETISDKIPDIDHLYKKPQFGKWRASMQASLWKTSNLKHLLKPGENPWEFEINGTKRSYGMKDQFLAITADSPMIYLNMANMGRISRWSYEQALKLNIPMGKLDFPLEREPSKLDPILKKFEELRRKIVRSKQTGLWIALILSWIIFFIVIKNIRKNNR